MEDLQRSIAVGLESGSLDVDSGITMMEKAAVLHKRLANDEAAALWDSAADTLRLVRAKYAEMGVRWNRHDFHDLTRGLLGGRPSRLAFHQGLADAAIKHLRTDLTAAPARPAAMKKCWGCGLVGHTRATCQGGRGGGARGGVRNRGGRGGGARHPYARGPDQHPAGPAAV